MADLDRGPVQTIGGAEQQRRVRVVRHGRADGGMIDPAALEDRRRPERARRDDHQVGVQVPRRATHQDGGARRTRAVEPDLVDERIGKDREVRAGSRRIEIGEGGVPAHSADGVDRDTAQALERVGRIERREARQAEFRCGRNEGPARRLERLEPRRTRSEHGLAAHEVGMERCEAPAVGARRTPFVDVRGRRPDDAAAVVGRAAADDPGPTRGDAALEAPVVRLGRVEARVEDVRRPPTGTRTGRSPGRPPRGTRACPDPRSGATRARSRPSRRPGRARRSDPRRPRRPVLRVWDRSTTA